MKSYLIRLIVAALFILIPQVSQADVAFENDPLVKIKILSKQARLLREGKINYIALLLQKNSIIYDEAKIDCVKNKKIIFTYTDGKWHSSCSQEAQQDYKNNSERFAYKISGTISDGFCVIKLDSEERKYPLPFEAVCDHAGLRFYTYERLSKYAIDSACAEYESSQWKEREAILALAHAIKARYHYSKKSPQHNDSDFCDLTHCHVYRGMSGSGIVLDDAWEIDYKNLKCNLFFHSRCGGHTFNESVFGFQKDKIESGTFSGVRDWLFGTGVRLCKGKDSAWNRSIGADELALILFEKQKPDNYLNFYMERDQNQIIIRNAETSKVFPVETLRLKINRVKGWSFLKSNNYYISDNIIKDKKIFHFKGEGLGHGVGLCQYGALTLSQMGYSRYEILEHYFPNIIIEKQKDKNNVSSPYLIYCVFNLSDGSIRSMNTGSGFLQRRIPPGSVFKLFVSMYLAKERQDLFTGYTYYCKGGNEDAAMPDRCWKPEGHGNVNLQEAIPNSCNLYFSSLYNKIFFKNFKVFFKQLCEKLGINANLPDIKNPGEWARLLAGLDSRISFSVNDYIWITRYLNLSAENATAFIPVEQRTVILKSLKDTFINGTASGKIKPYGSSKNYDGLGEVLKIIEVKSLYDFWGKTATIIDGSNKPGSYGLFIGGCGNTGVVTLLRKGNGSLAARWAQVLLAKEQEN